MRTETQYWSINWIQLIKILLKIKHRLPNDRTYEQFFNEPFWTQRIVFWEFSFNKIFLEEPASSKSNISSIYLYLYFWFSVLQIIISSVFVLIPLKNPPLITLKFYNFLEAINYWFYYLLHSFQNNVLLQSCYYSVLFTKL